MITIKTTKGDIRLRLDEDGTPQTVENFRQYMKNGFYKDTIFHRVIKNFMIQGGGMQSDMRQKETTLPVKNEAGTGKTNKRGTIAMARTSEPHSATSQFFINLVDNTFLNYQTPNAQGFGYCVFGEVVDGMDVVDAIAAVKTTNRMGHADVPEEEIKIVDIVEEAE